jgi:hypothetical protein
VVGLWSGTDDLAYYDWVRGPAAEAGTCKWLVGADALRPQQWENESGDMPDGLLHAVAGAV